MIKSNIKRLLQYRLCLTKFKELGYSRIFSYNLGNEAGVSPEQVRKDFSIHGITGNKKAGYEIESLLIILNQIFRMDEIHNVILVGMGHIGTALANYNNHFIGQNVYLVAGFDMDPAKQNKKTGIPVFPLDKLSELIEGFQVSTAIITVPPVSAQEVCNNLIDKGIKGILNFAPIVLKAPKNIIVNNINLSTEIEAIVYYLNQQK
ncbi:MAG: redox-sensing transcriptional repressor Rex [Bacteroidetes bacterium]|jgi:redox-sensing transcriptional repressor|nr:redox-sensing transcriptional repressor Rex [Bacteroidota bacterium]MBT3750362.1 redox-sensing transcriptional repressor Rex [Bacteroidota bacterium]MBT4399233.1 redox-sensing transcriptional repressor Rex [Bacteroidota bacterium]MBT4409983.1 redox-sensing transcriptional repressor Rex [Bacteroidota bacterium]MBT5425459.1 redox-sensing transcriptional repressor Rex [Bacteroidota bacterium]